MQRTTVTTSIATAAALCLAASGLASAQIAPAALPGTGADRVQVVVGSDLMDVTMDDFDTEATEVTGTITNNSEDAFNCWQAGTESYQAGPAGTVTRADLVQRSLDYMSNNVLPPPPPMPGLNPGSLDVMLGTGSLASLGMGDPGAIELADIEAQQDQARIAGHYGAVPQFNVPAGETLDWTATLTVPSGDRTDFDAAALFTCQHQTGDNQWYAFAVFADAENGDGTGGGSLPAGSLSMGSLGS